MIEINIQVDYYLLTAIIMNIEKIVANYFDKKRSESLQDRKQSSIYTTANKCYEPQNHSFQPTVNQMPRSIYKATTKTQCSREDIVQRLYADRRSLQGKRAYDKLLKQEKQYKQNCTFHPQTNPTSKRILKTQCTQQNPFQRLYMEGLVKKKLSQSANYMQQNKQNYSFQPQTNYKNILNIENCNMKPIYQRIDEIMREKKEKMKVLQNSLEDKTISDKPAINEISEKIVANKEDFKKGILNRMAGYLQQKKNKYLQVEQQREQHMMKQCTFKPQINNAIQISTNFHSRQEQYLRKIEDKMASRMRENNFQPQINKISQILMRQQRQGQTFEDKINRLAQDGNRRQRIQQIQRQLYQQCTFVPQINLISKCLTAQHISHKCNHTPCQQIYEFKPRINKISEELAKKVKLRKSQSADHDQFKREHLNQMKMQIEYRQLKQCTFKPKINFSRPKNASKNKNNGDLASVKGYQSFIKKIDRINQIRDQERQIQQRVFHREKSYKNRKSTTPVQFKLSQGYNIKQSVKQEIREKFQKQCTFKPKIISYR